MQGPAMLREVIMQLIRSPLSRTTEADQQSIWALRDVSFSIQTGEVVGIIGRNGAGKSTLLKILSRITRPTTGLIRVRGRVASLLEVGTGFHEELTGRENVYLCGCILGMPKKRIDAKLDEIVAFSEVERFLDTPIKRYSSGMRLRLGFAVAANLESDILLVDEVLAVGDGEFQRKCLRTMGDLHNTGRTVLFVSHNLAAVENLCSRAIWIDSGRFREDGTPAQVIQSYMATFASSRDTARDLRDIKERRGSGDIRFTHIELLAPDRSQASSIRCGDALVVRLHFDAAREVVAPIFGIDIHTALGTLVAQIHTYNDDFSIPALPPGAGHIDVRIDSLNFVPGQYLLSLYVANYGNLYHDGLEHCTSIDVQPSTNYGLMRGMKNPIVALACQWTLGTERPANVVGKAIAPTAVGGGAS
jgi:lipopolysaccharide transport system ATP-binding protein